MSTKQLVVVVLAIYAVVMVIVGAYTKRHTKGSIKESMIMRGKTPFWVLFGALLGMQMGSGFVVGGAEYGALYGLSGAWYGLGCAFSFIVCSQITCRIVYKRGYVSLADYFSQRYHGVTLNLIYTISTFLGCLAMMASQLLAGRAIFLAVGLPADQGVMMTALISLVYTLTTGFMGTMAISAVQSAVVFLGILAALCVMFTGAGWEVLPQTLPQSYFKMTSVSPELLVTLTVPQMFSVLANQGSFQRISSCKTQKTAQMSYLMAGLVSIPVAFIPPLLGMYGVVIFPGEAPAAVFMRLMLERLPIVVSGIVLAAIISAVMGTVNSLYVSVATIIVHDIYEGMLHKEADEKKSSRLMVIANVVVCICGVMVALVMNDIITVLALSYSLVTSGCMVPFLGGIFWERGNTSGAVASSFTGVMLTILNAVGIIHIPFSSLSVVLASTAAYVVGSLLTRREEVVDEQLLIHGHRHK